MKRIKCTPKSIPAIDEVLKAVNGRAKEFIISNAAFVASLGPRAEKYLTTHHVPHSDRTGATAKYNPAGPSSSYKYAAVSTAITLSRQAGRWYVTDIKKIEIWPNGGEHFTVQISDKAADNLARRAMLAFGREMSPTQRELRDARYNAESEIKGLQGDVEYLRRKLEQKIPMSEGGVREVRVREESALEERARIESKRSVQDAIVAKLERGEKLTPDEFAAI